MDFTSPVFLFLFLPLFIAVYSLVGGRIKLLVGIAGSVFFYSWGNSQYIFLIIALLLFSYLVGIWLDRWREKPIHRFILWGGIFSTLGLLVGYKLQTETLYPLGLSYIAFQVISYFFDVSKSAGNCEKDILNFSFYLLLFPKIPVGPIVPYRQVKSQIADLKSDSLEIAEGLRRFIKGLAKKVLIADTLATIVTPIFNLQSPVISPALSWLVILSYSLQLYYDFSGYTDMAIGLGRMMGLRFVENFDFPYLSRNISDFWRRWHISLSTWFRETVFFPLERRRVRWFGQQINILIVFILTGLWHGFTHNFFFWGLLHGVVLVFESTMLGRKVRTLWAPLQHLYALSVILIGWVIFRSPTLNFAFDYLRRLVGETKGIQVLPFDLTSPLPHIESTFLIAFIMGFLLCLPWKTWLQAHLDLFQESFATKLIYDLGMVFLFLASLASSASATYSPNIYGTF